MAKQPFLGVNNILCLEGPTQIFENRLQGGLSHRLLLASLELS